MQTGAFIQLILTLVAIASRIEALIPQMLDCISSLQTTIHRLLITVDVSTSVFPSRRLLITQSTSRSAGSE